MALSHFIDQYYKKVDEIIFQYFGRLNYFDTKTSICFTNELPLRCLALKSSTNVHLCYVVGVGNETRLLNAKAMYV